MQKIIQVSSREFRSKQKDYFDLADNGAQVILRRGSKQSYLLTPVDDEDLSLSSRLQERIAQGLEDIKSDKTKSYTLQELKERMGL